MATCRQASEQEGEVDLVLDLAAGETQERSRNVLEKGGTMISSLARPSEEQAGAHHVRARRFMAHPDRAELVEINRLIDEGRVHTHESAVFKLEEAREAQRQRERHHVQGRVDLQVGWEAPLRRDSGNRCASASYWATRGKGGPGREPFQPLSTRIR